MDKDQTIQQLLDKIKDLESRLEESDQLIDAIKAGEVDAFAIIGENQLSEVYTLQSGDYAYRILIEEFGEGAINVTEDGLIVYTNPYFFQLLKLPYEKVIGSTIYDFIHEDSLEDFKQIFAAGITGKSKGEINLSVNNFILPVYVSLTSLQPNLATVSILISDLTDKKKNEEVLLKYQKDLEGKNSELIKSNAELASFTYIASHDLQEPLRKIQTFASRINEKEINNLSDSGKEHFNRMQKAANRMQTLIEDLLAYSRTNTVERKFEHTELTEIVEDLQLDLAEELAAKNATIEIGEMCSADIIPFQFRQLLYNLFSNSLKFSKQGTAPVIKISSRYTNIIDTKENADEERRYCHIIVSDNGIGFESQFSEKIFDLFQRLHGKTEYIGTGIGLAIVKKIAENHNGFITATSELGKGATFNIYIPV